MGVGGVCYSLVLLVFWGVRCFCSWRKVVGKNIVENVEVGERGKEVCGKFAASAHLVALGTLCVAT